MQVSPKPGGGFPGGRVGGLFLPFPPALRHPRSRGNSAPYSTSPTLLHFSLFVLGNSRQPNGRRIPDPN